ncbi:MAG: cytochrome C biosynthesis protein [Reichenbachiella sp.]
MSKKKKSEEEHSNSLLENPEALAEQLSRSEQFIEKNKTIVFTIGAVIAIAIIGLIGGKYYLANQDANAQQDLFQSVYYFEADSLGLALNGDGNNYGFLEILDEYKMTDAANLASFYAGATYLKLGDFENALRYLKDFSGSDYLVQARAYALIGDAHAELGAFSEAASQYEKAANYNANKEFSPVYLQKAAIANEKAGDLAAALANYQTILNDYFGVPEYQEAKKHTARLQGKI